MDADAIEQMLYERAVNTKIRAPRGEGSHRFTSIVSVMGLLFLTSTFMMPVAKQEGRGSGHRATNASLSNGQLPGVSVSANQHDATSGADPEMVSIAMSQIGR